MERTKPRSDIWRGTTAEYGLFPVSFTPYLRKPCNVVSCVNGVRDCVKGVIGGEADGSVGGVMRFNGELYLPAQVVVLEEAVGFSVVRRVPAGVER
jgi:hypothetical protein